VEFALIAPVAMLMLVGVTDYGMAVYDRMQLSSAVRAGIQYAMHHSANPTTIEQVVMSALTIDHAAVTVTAAQVCECPGGAAAECDETCPDGPRRTFIRIDVTQQHDALFDYPGISNPTTLQAQAFVRIQ
jgi:Flp pilus assembly protein TadG